VTEIVEPKSGEEVHALLLHEAAINHGHALSEAAAPVGDNERKEIRSGQFLLILASVAMIVVGCWGILNTPSRRRVSNRGKSLCTTHSTN
jgi:hypothetical protein